MILLYPHPLLRQIAQPISSFDPSRSRIAKSLLEGMAAHRGLGLAAPQVGLSVRVVVIKADPPIVAFNPTITWRSNATAIDQEGCISLPELMLPVSRANEITVCYQDGTGQTCTRGSDGLEARVWQHELDHLDGLLIIDRTDSASRLSCRGQVKKLLAQHKARFSNLTAAL